MKFEIEIDEEDVETLQEMLDDGKTLKEVWAWFTVTGEDIWEQITEQLPSPITVGDTVTFKYNTAPFTVIAIDGFSVWVRAKSDGADYIRDIAAFRKVER